jgi:hypothetical protein
MIQRSSSSAWSSLVSDRDGQTTGGGTHGSAWYGFEVSPQGCAGWSACGGVSLPSAAADRMRTAAVARRTARNWSLSFNGSPMGR